MRISIEPFHVYGLAEWDETELSEYLRTRLRTVKELHGALIERHECTFSILLDEAITVEFRDKTQSVWREIEERVVRSWSDCLAQANLDPRSGHVVVEKKLIGRAHTLLDRLVRPFETVSVDADRTGADLAREHDVGRFIKNYVAFEELSDGLNRASSGGIDVSPMLNLGEMTQHPGIGLACELYEASKVGETLNERRPSCALLAATWQLDRLGYFGKPTGADTQFDGTLGLLDSTFQPVETAVRLILRHAPDGSGSEGNRPMDDYLDRIAYQFSSGMWNSMAVLGG